MLKRVDGYRVCVQGVTLDISRESLRLRLLYQTIYTYARVKMSPNIDDVRVSCSIIILSLFFSKLFLNYNSSESRNKKGLINGYSQIILSRRKIFYFSKFGRPYVIS